MWSMENPAEPWERGKAQRIKTSSIKTDPTLQPRMQSVLKLADQRRAERESDEHVRMMADALRMSPGFDLPPVWLVRSDGKLRLADGHHRRRAYLMAGRPMIPAIIVDTSLLHAVHASKVANLGDAKLRMEKEQRMEACFQYLAAVRPPKEAPWPKAATCASAAARYGITADTVSRMRRKIVPDGDQPGIDPREYSAAAKDPGTGFPLWKYVRGNAIRDRFDDVSLEARKERQALKDAQQFMQRDPERRRRMLQLVLADAALVEGREEAEEVMAATAADEQS